MSNKIAKVIKCEDVFGHVYEFSLLLELEAWKDLYEIKSASENIVSTKFNGGDIVWLEVKSLENE